MSGRLEQPWPLLGVKPLLLVTISILSWMSFEIILCHSQLVQYSEFCIREFGQFCCEILSRSGMFCFCNFNLSGNSSVFPVGFPPQTVMEGFACSICSNVEHQHFLCLQTERTVSLGLHCFCIVAEVGSAFSIVPDH